MASDKLKGMFSHLHQPHFIFTGEIEGEGFCVVEVDTSRNVFSITGNMYPTEEAYKLGNEAAVFAAGCIHEEVARAVPELAQFIPLHLSSIATGTPDNLKNALHFLKPDGELAHERAYRVSNGRKNHWQSPDDDSQLHNYFIGITVRILRVNDIDTFKTLLTERANEVFPADDGEEPWSFEDVIDSAALDRVWQALIDFLSPAWMEQAAEFATWLKAQPEPKLIPADEPTEEFEHTFPNGLYVKSVVKDETVSSPIMKGEYVYGYNVTLKYDGVHNAHLSATGSVADHWAGHKDARGAAFGILREIGSIYEEGDDFWEMIEVNPRSSQARSGNAKAEKFGEAITANRDIIGY
jgi:hypothetical protein